MAEIQNSFTETLMNLRGLRSRLVDQIRGVDEAISSLERVAGYVGPQATTSPSAGTRAPVSLTKFVTDVNGADFSKISVRWAILWYLTEFATTPEKTGEIADALRRGGAPSGAKQFGNFVSSVLSTMKSKGEVQTVDEGFEITESGRQTWNLIKQGGKFREAIGASTAPPLLTEQ